MGGRTVDERFPYYLEGRIPYSKEKNVPERLPFAKRLRYFRRRHGVTCRELGQRWHIREWTVWHLEKGHYKPFDWMIVKLDELQREYEFAERKELDELQGLS